MPDTTTRWDDPASNALQDLIDAANELRRLDLAGLEDGDYDTAMEAVVRYDFAARAHVGLVGCSRCGEDSYIRHGRFHQSFYTATCDRCLYVNVRDIPEGLNP